jgi:CspA family cold shock protein
MESGRVKWFDSKRGFGFIAPDNRLLKDLFVHYKNISGDGYRSLVRGQAVYFEVSHNDKGLQAENVVMMSSMCSETELVDSDAIGNLGSAQNY